MVAEQTLEEFLFDFRQVVDALETASRQGGKYIQASERLYCFRRRIFDL